MSVEKTVFGTLSDGREAALYTLKNAAGMTLVVTPYGCRIIQLLVPDKDGKLGDVVLGHRTLEEYFGANYQGTFVGRYANRIGGAEFTLNGKTYTLAKNDGNNTLHGGPGGYHQGVVGRPGPGWGGAFHHLYPHQPRRRRGLSRHLADDRHLHPEEGQHPGPAL